MSPIDMDDHSKEYVFDSEDNLEEGQLIILGMINQISGDSEDMGEGMMDPNTYISERYYSSPDSDTVILRWSDIHQAWTIIWHDEMVTAHEDVDMWYVYDPDSVSGYVGYVQEEIDGGVDLTDIRLDPNRPYLANGNFRNVNLDMGVGVMYTFIIDNGTTIPKSGMVGIGEQIYEIVSVSDVQIDSDGKLIFGDPQINYNGQIVSQKQITGLDVNVPYEFAIYYPATVNVSGGSSGSESGVAGTIIGVIPVFVILSILGSVAYMVVNRNESE